MYVCICMAVTEKDIRDAAASGFSAAEIMEQTGAGTRCGTCRSTVTAILDGSAKEAPTASRRFRTYSAALLPSI